MGIFVWRTLMAMKARLVVPHIFLYACDHFMCAFKYFSYTIN